MADGTTGGAAVVNLYRDNILFVTVVRSNEGLTEEHLPVLTAENGEFLGWFTSDGVKVEVGDNLSSAELYLYSQWEYYDVIIDGQILFDIAEAIRDLLGTTTKYTPSQFAEAIRSAI